MEDVARGHRWLFERREKDGTHRYYLRARVPKGLVDVLGKREIKKSLATSDRREALQLIDMAAAEVNEMFAAARRKKEQTRFADLTEAEVRRLIFLWFRRQDEEGADQAFATTGDDRASMLENADEEAAAFAKGEGSFHVEHEIQILADQVLLANGFPSKPAPEPKGPIRPVTKARVPDVDHESDAYRLLCELVRRGVAEAARRQVQRLRGQPASTFDSAFSPEAVQSPASGPPLSRIFEKWLAEREPPAKTERDWRTAVRRFTELHGDLAVDAVEKRHVVELKDALLRVPAVLPHRLRKLPLPEIVAASKGGGAKTLSAPAVGKMLTAIKTLMNFAVTNGYVPVNVAQGVTVAKQKQVADKRVAYSAEDLRKIFESTGSFRETHPARFWLPRLAAFTGARLDELGQLTTEDIRRRDGIDFISINAEGKGKSLKTASSVRDIPIHPKLVAMGFIDHVAARQVAGGGPLFPDLRPDSLGKLTGSFSKWWTRHRRSIGLDDPRKVFHSFRHGFKEACRAAGISEEIHDALTGHGGGVGRGYGKVPLMVTEVAIKKLRYKGLSRPNDSP